MKWKVNSKPKEGDTRTLTKFAWFPVFVYRDTELYKVWLETYRVTEEYKKVAVYNANYYRYELRWKVIKREPLFWEHES